MFATERDHSLNKPAVLAYAYSATTSLFKQSCCHETYSWTRFCKGAICWYLIRMLWNEGVSHSLNHPFLVCSWQKLLRRGSLWHLELSLWWGRFTLPGTKVAPTSILYVGSGAHFPHFVHLFGAALCRCTRLSRRRCSRCCRVVACLWGTKCRRYEWKLFSWTRKAWFHNSSRD